MNERETTSFCGLWCNDCIPSNERLFALAAELGQVLEEVNFKHYVGCKSLKVQEFRHYAEFIKVLHAIEKLHCHNHCYKGPVSTAGCARNCKIRMCVLENNYEGCWQCHKYETCEYITDMKKMHPDIIDNLNAIRTYGIEKWSEHRGRHYNF